MIGGGVRKALQSAPLLEAFSICLRTVCGPVELVSFRKFTATQRAEVHVMDSPREATSASLQVAKI